MTSVHPQPVETRECLGGGCDGPANPTACDSLSCWCRRWPERWIASTGTRYTMEELPPEGRFRVFRYRYLEAA